MFTIDDFIQLMKYFKGDSSYHLDEKTIITAEDSKAKTLQLFNDNIDLICYTTEDYKRLKNFLVPWYASLRTFSSTMRNASDVRSLPSDHMNELLKSFGVVDKLDSLTEQNKVEFFYDLVNLYKIKGTPESIFRVLGYFGIPNVEIIEYYLQYDSNYNLVFHPLNLSPLSDITEYNLPFSTVTSQDPHWMLSESQINQLFLQNRIAFPSKTPYFSIRPTSEVLSSSGGVYSILTRIVLDQYDDYVSGSAPVKDISFQETNLTLSMLDLYLGCIYSFNLLFNKTTDSSDLSTIVYNGSMSDSYSTIIELFNNLLERSNNTTRDLLASNKILFDQNFTRLRSTNFLNSFSAAGDVLTLIHPDLKILIDSYYNTDSADQILKNLLLTLTSWVQDNISSSAENLVLFMFGFDYLSDVTKIINFFKPNRARLLFINQTYKINNPLCDSVITDDNTYYSTTDTFIDYDVGDSEPGFPEGYIPDGYDITSTPPDSSSKRIMDICVDSTGVLICRYVDTTSWTDISSIIYSEPNIGDYRITNMYFDILPGGGNVLYVDYYSTPETISGIRTKIESLAPTGYYTIYDLYLNSLLNLEVKYNNVPIDWPIDSTARIYFSRITYDCDSYFDIGASMDHDDENHDLFITQENEIVQNYHKGDATFDYHYCVDSTGDVMCVISDSGWSDFDTGMLFDSSMQSDVIKIRVYDVLAQISQTEDDGSCATFLDSGICEIGT